MKLAITDFINNYDLGSNPKTIEGILYHLGFDALHQLWNVNANWKLIKKSIISSLPYWLGIDQKINIANDIEPVFNYLIKKDSDDHVIDINTNVSFNIFNGKLDAVLSKKINNQHQFVIREIKSSQSYYEINYKHLFQLAMYAIGLEEQWNLEDSINYGEVVSISPPFSKTYNLTNAKNNILNELRGDFILNQSLKINI